MVQFENGRTSTMMITRQSLSWEFLDHLLYCPEMTVGLYLVWATDIALWMELIQQ